MSYNHQFKELEMSYRGEIILYMNTNLKWHKLDFVQNIQHISSVRNVLC